MIARASALCVVTALVSGCGFKLRTWDLAVAFETASISAASGVDLDRELARALRSAGVRVVEAEADVVLQLADQRNERRSVAVTSAGRTAEYELTLEVAFGVTDRDGQDLAATRLLRSERVARLDRDNIVGSSEEQALLGTEMRNDLVSQMLRTLGAIGSR